MLLYWNILAFAVMMNLFMRRLHGQQEASQTQANECRHVAKLSSPGYHASYTARCHIPTKRVHSSTASLYEMIPDEWRWVYEHNGSVSGQAMVRTRNSVYIVSQKDCLDLGKARGRPARSVYGIVGENRSRTDVYGQFRGIPRFNVSLEDNGEGPDLIDPINNDAYAECVFDYSQLNTYTSWGSGKPLPNEMAQMVKTVKGGHTGEGQTLTEYNFDYSNEELNQAFRRLVDDALENKTVDKKEDIHYSSHHPITLTDYVYETGLSILGPRSAAKPGDLRRDFFRDNSNLAWHRALEAKSALSNRQDPPPSLPDEFKPNDLISFTVLYIVVAFLFERALKDAVKMRQNAICKWDNPTGRWALLEPEKILTCTTSLDRIFGSYSGGLLRESRAGTMDITCAFITGIGSMVGAVLEFSNSAYRRQDILVVTSGGAITYGPSLTEFSIDHGNFWAGAEFSVNHWMVLNISQIGYRWVVPLVYSVYAILFLYVCRAYFVFSLRREHNLDFCIIRAIYWPVKWPVLLVLKFIARRITERVDGSSQIILFSYEAVYEGIFNKLADSYGYERLMPEEKPEQLSFWTCFERFNIDRFLPNRRALRPSAGMNAGFSFEDRAHGISRNQIEKCAEILAADRFGLLGRHQALTLMYNEGAAKAANRFVTENQLPDAREIQQLSLVYYVRHVVVPDGEGRLISQQDFDFINVGELIRTNLDITRPDYALEPICPVIGYRPREEDADRAARIMRESSTRRGNFEARNGETDEWFPGNVIYISLDRRLFIGL